MIKTYRGMLDDGGQDKIALKTLKGEIGYKIVKFELFPHFPGTADYEAVVKIYKLKQSSVPTSSATVNFTDSDTLGVTLYTGTSTTAPSSITTIFDQEIFNQDIYITHTANSGSAAINYYLELEQVKLNDNESTMATLQSLRRFALPRN